MPPAWTGVAWLSMVAMLAGCGPKARIPPLPAVVPDAVDARDPIVRTAQALAPVLYLHPDTRFRLARAVAVVHPTRRVIAYHVLWRDDVHGAWIPFTKPTDQEIAWVGYDSTGAPTDLWTYWHGVVLHTPWRDSGTVQVDVQWGKNGLLPRGTYPQDLPFPRTLGIYWLISWIGLPDIWLGNARRKGPWCFCGGYGRYRDFSGTTIRLGARLDAIVRTEDPDRALRAVFGEPYSRKRPWPFPSAP